MKVKIKITLIFCCALFLTAPFLASADFGGQQTDFFVNKDFDLFGRDKLKATLLRITEELYFYVDNKWWGDLTPSDQQTVKFALQDLGVEFHDKIYPTLTSKLGFEYKPGIDGDNNITILLHPLAGGFGGYVNTADEYLKLQVGGISNEREMIYLNADYIASPLAHNYLAHEFTHLIIFNQKERRLSKAEDTWLNELIADYTPTILGYEANYNQSTLKKRVETFLKYPNDSITEWASKEADYGALRMFSNYLVEQYGFDVLVAAVKSNKTGIASLNEALQKSNPTANFSRAFTNWSTAIYLNDCSLGSLYCYQNANLKNVKVVPKISFLPFGVESSFSLTEQAKNWQGHWHKIIGGGGTLKINFSGFAQGTFLVPYVTEYQNNTKEVGFLPLSALQVANFEIADFNNKATALILIPSLQTKQTGFTNIEETYPYFLKALVDLPGVNDLPVNNQPNETDELTQLLAKIALLEKQIALLKVQLAQAVNNANSSVVSGGIESNLKQGDTGEQVRLLQTWLAKDTAIYPQGLVTGYFGPLTKAAVIKFQEKYATDVLAPWGLSAGTGFVGATTRAKLNSFYNN